MAKKAKKKTAKVAKKTATAKAITKATPVRSSKQNNMGLAIVALILNLILPGVGSLIGGKTKEGIWQLVLVIIGLPLMLVLIGFPIILIAWIWGIVTGAKLIQENSK